MQNRLAIFKSVPRMISYCLLIFAFLVDPASSSGSLRELLKSFEDSETDLNYITIINLDFKETINDNIDIMDSPIVVLDIKEGFSNMNFLNHRRVDDLESLKFFFNSKIMSVVFFGNTTQESVIVALQFLKFHFMQRTILVFDNDVSIKEFVPLFRRFQNLIILNVNDFESSRNYSDNMKTSHVFNGGVPPKTVIKDISGEKVIVNAFRITPYCFMRYNEISKRYEYYGILSHVIENFIQYINGTPDFISPKELDERNITAHAPLEGANLTTYVQFVPSMSYSKNMLICLLRSNPIEPYKVFLVFNSPGQIDMDSYSTRPLDHNSWICIIVFIFYASILYTVSRRLIKINKSYWASFSIVLRGILAQSFEMERTLVCIIVVVFGFMLTICYSALLGSYLTTLIYEDPLEDWSDVVEKNLTVMIMETFNKENIRNNIPELGMYKDYIKYVPSQNRLYYGPVDPNRALIGNTGFWKYMMELQMKFYNTRIYRRSKFNFGRSFLFIYHEHHLKYKYRLNYFLALIKETGLYNYWCSQAVYENLKYKFYPNLTIRQESAVNILTVRYFRKIFIIWGSGMLLGSVVFCLEMVKKLISGFRIDLIIKIEF